MKDMELNGASKDYPSLNLAYDWVKGVLEKQSHTSDALDTKTATLFSVGTAIFSLGLGIPLTTPDLSFSTMLSSPFAWVVIISYICIAVFAFIALWVRRYVDLDNPIVIRESFWALPELQFKLELLSHLEDAFEDNELILVRKASMTRLIIPAVAIEALFLVLFLGFAF